MTKQDYYNIIYRTRGAKLKSEMAQNTAACLALYDLHIRKNDKFYKLVNIIARIYRLRAYQQFKIVYIDNNKHASDNMRIEADKKEERIINKRNKELKPFGLKLDYSGCYASLKRLNNSGLYYSSYFLD